MGVRHFMLRMPGESHLLSYEQLDEKIDLYTKYDTTASSQQTQHNLPLLALVNVLYLVCVIHTKTMC